MSILSSITNSARQAARVLAITSTAQKNQALFAMADALVAHQNAILSANAADLDNARNAGMRTSLIDRLTLTEARINGMADAIREVAALPDPCGCGEVFTRPNGLVIRRMAVPLGVVGIIYEARPNVTADAAALCLKSGNACILKGGKEAFTTNRLLVSILRDAIESAGLPADSLAMPDDPSREIAKALMEAVGEIDLLIPRGSAALIQAVKRDARVPVIETGAGNCHVFVDESADVEMAINVTLNAKASRPSVCNAAETLLVHRSIATEFLPAFAKAASALPSPIELRGDEAVQSILTDSIIPATEEDWSTEYGDLILAVKIVDSVSEAIAHINRYSTGHSEAILTRDMDSARRFQAEIDSAVVYVNASTRFTDGGEFGLGAEIGISTQKLHARGPMGLTALTTVRYLVDGNGQIR